MLLHTAMKSVSLPAFVSELLLEASKRLSSLSSVPHTLAVGSMDVA